MSRRLILGCIMLTVTIGCASKSDSGSARNSSSATDSKGQPKGRKGLVYSADVLPVEAKPVTFVIGAPGVIEAFERVQVTARVAGAVDRVAFSEGQNVKQGQVLVSIDADRYLGAVNSAKAALDKAIAAQKDAESMVTRRQGASEQHPGLITGEELATYQTKAATAKADTQVAVEALKAAQLNLRDSSVRAPIQGVIQTRTVETGQYVQAGYLMATLLRQDPMLLRFEVETADALRIKPGMTATFTMRETPTTFNAKITLVAGAADSTSHMVPVTAELTDKEHKYWLRPGSFCDVTVELPHEQRLSPTIPRMAARATDHGYIGYVVEGDTARERPLTLGMNTKDGWVEVRSGLKAGDLLVVHGGEALSSGAKVKATQVTAASIAGDLAGVSVAPVSSAAHAHPGAASTGAPAHSAGSGAVP